MCEGALPVVCERVPCALILVLGAPSCLHMGVLVWGHVLGGVCLRGRDGICNGGEGVLKGF